MTVPSNAVQIGTLAWVTAQIQQMGATIARLTAEVEAFRAAFADAGIRPREASIADIVRMVAEDYGLAPKLLCGDWRRGDMVEARWIAMWIAREGFGRHLSVIGACMGRRDHKTVVHGVAAVTARRERDPEFRTRTDRLREQATRIINGDH